MPPKGPGRALGASKRRARTRSEGTPGAVPGDRHAVARQAGMEGICASGTGRQREASGAKESERQRGDTVTPGAQRGEDGPRGA